MRPLTLEEMAAAMSGRVLGTITQPRVTAVSIDSRKIEDGSLFFAIIGEHHDGHTFVNDALNRGAVAAVVSGVNQIDPALHDAGRLILVPDTVLALGQLAAWYRRQFAAQVIAVAGSNGKTSVKELIHTVLGASMPGKAAPASFNNQIGVPLTLLSVEPADEYVVVEVGTNHPGEVATLARIARPDLAVITSIGEEHLEFFGDVATVAREEFSLLLALGRRGFAAISEDAAALAPARSLQNATVLRYGLSDQAALRASDLTPDGHGLAFRVNGRFDYRIPLPGRHNVLNALAAIAIGNRCRLEHDQIAAALRRAKLPPMRLERQTIGSVTVINDAYNANPGSMRAAFDVLDRMAAPGRKVLVLGDMRELGEASTRCHQQIGREAGRSTAHVIVAVGAYARVVADGATVSAGPSKRIYAYPSIEIAAEKLPGLLEPHDTVLLKASRGVRLERLIPSIQQLTQPAVAHARR